MGSMSNLSNHSGAPVPDVQQDMPVISLPRDELELLECMRTTSPFENRNGMLVASLSKGEVVYAAPAGLVEPFERVFVKGRGWFVIPSSCLGRVLTVRSQSTDEVVYDASLAAKDERYKVVHELALTEQTYGAAMKLVTKTILTPLRQGNVLSDLELAKVFSCVETIAELSGIMLQKLRQRLALWVEGEFKAGCVRLGALRYGPAVFERAVEVPKERQ